MSYVCEAGRSEQRSRDVIVIMEANVDARMRGVARACGPVALAVVVGHAALGWSRVEAAAGSEMPVDAYARSTTTRFAQCGHL